MCFIHKTIASIFTLFCGVSAMAQTVVPVTRFHVKDNPYVYYDNEFLSGFMQTAGNDTRNGFLQMPFVGDPLLVYVGEKDSTQYMAYASGYDFKSRRPDLGKYQVELTRYGIKANIESHAAYSSQEYAYPDTVAEKGFLLDLDNAMSGAPNEDMDVYLLDKYTVRAYKRSTKPGSVAPELYYYARFSHPFKTWNIRRERVTLDNGSKETRCKVSFTFPLKKNEKLKVASAVSTVSTDKAYAMLEGHMPEKHFNDEMIVDFDRETAITASSRLTAHQSGNTAKQQKQTTLTHRQTILPPAPKGPVDYIEITTREADLRAAFYASISVLKQLPAYKRVRSADELLKAIVPLYYGASHTQATPAETDSLLHTYAKNLFAGSSSHGMSPSQAAWYVFNAIGFRPTQTPDTYEVVRPLFNITALYLSNGRRLILHTKNNSSRNFMVEKAELMHQPLSEGYTFTHQTLLRGGVLEVKMTRVH